MRSTTAPPTGADLRDLAVAKALRSEPGWAEAAYKWVIDLPYGTTFTSEDITDEVGGPRTADPRAVGGIILGLAKRNLIRPTGGLARSNRRSRHAGIMREWVRA